MTAEVTLPVTHKTEERLIDINEVQRMTGFGTSFLYKAMKENRFPKPLKFHTSSRWVYSQVQGWIEKQIEKAGQK